MRETHAKEYAQALEKITEAGRILLEIAAAKKKAGDFHGLNTALIFCNHISQMCDPAVGNGLLTHVKNMEI